jgi:8-oxo-dGTP diphosphatase
MPEQRLQIVVGIIFNRDHDKVLIARRRPGTHQGGLWEFPGGKRHAGETGAQALSRELEEELAIQMVSAHPLLRFDYDYPDIVIRLDVWVVDEWQGRPQGREGQEILWASTMDLDAGDFPDADRRIIRMLTLPSVYFITPDSNDYGEAFFARLETLLQSGIRLVRFRSRNLAGPARRKALSRAATLCRRYDSILISNGTADAVTKSGCQGLHLSARELMQLEGRPAGDDIWIAASCHNKEELLQACRIGLDFCVLSPVQPTISHPLIETLGWPRFAELAAAATIPVYALGGMQPADLAVARRHGAHGIAMISGLWEESGS